MKKTILILTGLLVISSTAYAQKPINVVATVGQLANVVEIIGGKHLKVEGLMGPGVDPHLYKASESDVRKLANADIIFYNGLYLEAKMDTIFKKMSRNIKTVAVGEFLEKDRLLDSIAYSGHYDPHIWFDVTIWTSVTKTVLETLIEFDPTHAEEYSRNATEYIENELNSLHTYVSTRANELPESQRVLVTAHDAFRYFGKAYGFEVIGLQGISTEAQAGTKDVIELANFIAERKIRAVFVESSVPVRNIKAVQEAVKSRGWDVKIGGELFSDAMGDEGTEEGTYIGMVKHNIDTIVDALKQPKLTE